MAVIAAKPVRRPEPEDFVSDEQLCEIDRHAIADQLILPIAERDRRKAARCVWRSGHQATSHR